jgi:hypothetical protein
MAYSNLKMKQAGTKMRGKPYKKKKKKKTGGKK